MQALRRSAITGALAACALGALGSTPVAAVETLTLETRGVPGAAVSGPVFSAPLTPGATYYARVAGTASIYKHTEWLLKKGLYTPCGLPEQAPLFPTPGATNGVVGMDAEAVFGVPPFAYFHGFHCGPTAFPFRITKFTDGGVQFAQGGAFAHGVPIGGPRDVPRADHTYTYPFTGDGEKLAVRWVDKPLQDDYGQFRIEILTEAECAAQNCIATAQPSQDQKPAPGAVTQPLAQPASDTGSKSKTCVSRRNFRVRVRKYRGVKIRAAKIEARGKTYVMVRRGLRIRSSVDLRGLPYGTFKIKITATTSRGQRLVDTRTYRTCRIKPKS